MPFTYRKEDIKEAKLFITKGKIPANLKSKRDKERFKKKWGNGKIKKGKIYLSGKEVIYKSDVVATIKEVYDDPKKGLVGRDKLFYKIKNEYVGISRRDINNFLNNHETQQVHRSVPKTVTSRPIGVSKPLARWQIDLVIINKPEKRILMTVIDIFSKYAWVKLLKSKHADVIVAALRSIFVKENPNLPTLLHSDNGSEFVNAKFKKLLKQFKIKHTLGQPYTPQQQAQIERFNKTFKTMLARYQTHWNNTYLTQNIIDDLLHNYNHNIHSTTKRVPAEIHPKTAGRYKRTVPQMTEKETRKVKRNIQKTTNKTLKNNTRFSKIEKGDHVRINKDRIKLIKPNPFKKSYLKNWSFEIFQVISVSRPSRKNIHPVYTLKDIETGKKINRRFYRHELLKIDKDKLVVELGADAMVVEKIVDKRKKKGRIQYLVKHLNMPKSKNLWYYKTELNADDAIKDFERMRK